MYVFPPKLSHARSCNLNHILFLKEKRVCIEFKNQDFIKPRLQIFLFHLQIGECRNTINSRRVSKLQSMTNACLGFLLQELSKKCWELKRRSSQLEVMGELWKANMSQCYILPPEQSVPSTAQEGRGAGICSIPALLGTAALSSLLRAALTPPQVGGKRDRSLSIPVTSSSSHTAGNYLGWDHWLDKQEKEMGTW